MQAYCFRCRAKREITDPHHLTLRTGRQATQGRCPQCNAKLFRIAKAS